jgi:hypothetical protein
LAALSHQLGLVFAGLFLYTLLVARQVSSPRFWRRMLAADAEAARQLPGTAELADESLRVVVCSLRNGYGEIERVLRRAPAPIRAHAHDAVTSLDALRAEAAQMVRDADALHRYLRTTPKEALDRELERLRVSLAHAGGDARAAFERAIAIREEQLGTVERIRGEHERLYASLQLLVASVEAFPSRIHRLQFLERRAKDDMVGELNAELARLELDLSSSQRLLEGLAQDPAQLVGADPASGTPH